MANSEVDEIAARLQSMTAEAPAETRSVENPALAVSPALLDGIWGYGPTRSGVQINEDTALTFTAVFSAVKVLSESIGMLPLAVFEGDDDHDVKVRARQHPAYSLLRWSPNDETTAVTFKESLQANTSLWGNGYARIEFKNNGDPAVLRPLLSSQVTTERQAGNLRYKVRNGRGGTFAPEEILHIPGLSLNGIVGLSTVAYCRESIATGKAAEIFGSTFFGNGANLAGVIEWPAGSPVKPEQMRTFIESFNALYAGVGNANKTGYIPGGGVFKRIGMPPEDAQFLETRKFSVEEVARMFRIPPHMLASMDRATNNNIEQASLEFLIYTLTPWLEKWEQECTRKLCTDGKFHVKFDESRLLRTDMAARMALDQSGLQWGYYNPDEVRANQGKPPLPNGQGQIYRTPVNMEPMAILAAMAANGFRPQAPPHNPADPAQQPSAPPAPAATAPSTIRQLRPILIDALRRMHTKELKAIQKQTANDGFYQEHCRHVREAIMPVLVTVANGGVNLTRAIPVIERVADTKHVGDPGWFDTAEKDADTIIDAIEDSSCSK